ncbi:BC1881 family protein [Priestia aryabhattai]
MAEEQRESNKKVILGDYALDIDVSSALTGLKAVKRCANEAVQAMEKLDDYSGKASFLQLGDMIRIGSLEAFSTEELHEELAKREGVQEVIVDNHRTMYLQTAIGAGGSIPVSGPARILINKD